MILETNWVDGYLHASKDGVWSPIMLHGTPAPNTHPGLFTSPLFAGLHPLYILGWSDRAGDHAFWFLDENFNYIANNIVDLREAGWPHLLQCVESLAIRLRSALLLGAVAEEREFMAGLLSLDATVVSGLLALAPELLALPTSTYEAADLANVSFALSSGEDSRAIELDADAVRHVFSLSAAGMAPKIAASGRFLMPSLIGTGTVECGQAFILSDNVFGYRFRESGSGLTWIAIASTYTSIVAGLYFPAGNLLLVDHLGMADFLSTVFPGKPIEISFQEHLTRFAYDLVASELSEAPKRIAFLWHNTHLGHHLWQDLTGAHAVHSSIDAKDVPQIVVVGSEQTEMWGELDALFPKFAGKVLRGLPTLADAAGACYWRGLVAISPTLSFIPAQLPRLIVDHNLRSSACIPDVKVSEDARASDTLVVLLGLRVENRTVVDFKQFCLDLIFRLSGMADSLVVVVDGHNQEAGSTRVLSSFADQYARRAPIDVEREIVAALHQKFEGSNVSLVSLIGQPMARSVFWSVKCDFFITPWGAGLAKYRWVANSDGLVLAGASFLDEQVGLDIYSSANIMEESGPVSFIGREFVEDAADDEQLIGVRVGPQTRDNFRVSMDGVEEAIRQLIDNRRSTKALRS